MKSYLCGKLQSSVFIAVGDLNEDIDDSWSHLWKVETEKNSMHVQWQRQGLEWPWQDKMILAL